MPEPNLLSDPIVPPPQMFTSQGTVPTLVGLIDGTNAVYSTGVVLRRAQIWKNGLMMTLNVDVVFGAPSQYVKFLDGHIPQTGDSLLIYGWI